MWVTAARTEGMTQIKETQNQTVKTSTEQSAGLYASRLFLRFLQHFFLKNSTKRFVIQMKNKCSKIAEVRLGKKSKGR